MPARRDAIRPTITAAGTSWVAWHSKVRIAVLTAALFMALC
jgi:hypothetical protein